MLNVLILNLSQLKPFVSIWSIKPSFPLIQSLSKSFQVYPSNTSPINFSLHLLAIFMIKGLRTFPRSLHSFFFPYLNWWLYFPRWIFLSPSVGQVFTKIRLCFPINYRRRSKLNSQAWNPRPFTAVRVLPLSTLPGTGLPMAPHSSSLAWKIPWMEEPGRL